GTIGKVGETFTINIRIVDISTGQIVHTDNTDCKCTIDQVLSKSTVDVAHKASVFINPNNTSAKDKEKSFINRPWTYISAGVILAGGAAVTYFLVSEPDKKQEDKLIGTIIQGTQ
ncbi:MAG: hypothetical protein HQK83_20270, partial [Fibrobacteria bacterium]|nr:hypothetical protein [Fibrobacteria bacterium]